MQQLSIFDSGLIVAEPPAPEPAVTLYLSIIVEPGGLCQITLDADAAIRPSDDTCHWSDLPQHLPRFVERALPSEYWGVLG